MGNVAVICGTGNGKTTSSIGRGIKAISEGKSVSIIQFLKGVKESKFLDVLKRMEPEMKVFRFEKFDGNYEELNKEQKEEETLNITNGINFAKKVISTGGSDVVILDEILGLIDIGYMTVDELIDIIKDKPEDVSIILTGQVFPGELEPYVDSITILEDKK